MPSPSVPRFNTPGVRFNEGFFFGGPPSKPKTKMASLALNLSRLNPTLNIALADQVLAKMDPPAPGVPGVPGLTTETAAYKTARNTAHTSNQAYEQARVALAGLKAARDADHDALKVEQTALSKAVEAKAKGDAVILAASGFPLAVAASQSTEPPGAVFNFTLTQGDMEGALDGSHDRPARAVNFEVQITTLDPVAGPYQTVLSPTSSSWQLSGLTSGQRVWVRVRANGANGPGPWSDPATKIVP